MPSDLEKETRDALLTRIHALAAEANGYAGIEQLANAFALTVGAKLGHLPGALDAS